MRRWILGGLLAAALTACGTSAPPGDTPTEPSQTAQPSARHMTPTAIRIPSIGVASTTPWKPLGIQASGEVEVPDVKRPELPGWYCPSGVDAGCGAPMPGATGPLIVLAHIDGNGKAGLFKKLSQLKVGALVEVDREDGKTVVYRISRTQVVDKNAFPSQAVYGDTKGSEIRLVSCGGRYSAQGRRYLDQIISYGSMVELKPKAA